MNSATSKRGSIRTLVLVCGISIAAAGLIGTSAVLVTATVMHAHLEETTRFVLEDEASADRIVTGVYDQLLELDRYINNPSPATEVRFRELGNATYEQLRTYLVRDLSAEERLLIEALKEKQQQFEVDAQTVFLLASRHDFEAARSKSEGLTNLARTLQADLERLVMMRAEQRARMQLGQMKALNWLYVAGGVLFLFLVGGVLVLLRILNRRVIAPMNALADAARRVGAGDLDARVLRHTADEFGLVTENFNNMLDRLQDAHTDVRAAEARFRSLVTNIPAVVWESDAETWDTSYVSPYAEALFGYSVEEFLASPEIWQRVIHPDDLPRVSRLCNQAVSTGQDVVLEYRGLRKDGATLWLRDLVSVIPATDQRPARLRGIIFDLTERVAAEEALAESQRNLRHMQKMEAVGRLAGGISHDFNNLLTAIRGHADLLVQEPLSATARADIEEIVKATGRAAELTRQLMSFSRKQLPVSEIVEVNAVVRDMERMLRRLIGENIELRVDTTDHPLLVRIDRLQMEQVLLNLAVNARDALAEGGVLGINTAAVDLDHTFTAAHSGLNPGAFVLLTISDNGPGMTDEIRSRIFEPFFTTKPFGKGTGLGLSVVYGIVRQNHGAIVAESAPGHGATFRIWLPVTSDSETRTVENEEVLPESNAETLLLVEDEPAVRSLARRILSRHGYTVLEAGDGLEALAVSQAFDGDIHALVSDIVMPRMSGIQLAARIIRERPHIRVLFMSGYTEEEIGPLFGSDIVPEFLPKPFTAARLISAVGAVLSNGRVRPQEEPGADAPGQ